MAHHDAQKLWRRPPRPTDRRRFTVRGDVWGAAAQARMAWSAWYVPWVTEPDRRLSAGQRLVRSSQARLLSFGAGTGREPTSGSSWFPGPAGRLVLRSELDSTSAPSPGCLGLGQPALGPWRPCWFQPGPNCCAAAALAYWRRTFASRAKHDSASPITKRGTRSGTPRDEAEKRSQQ